MIEEKAQQDNILETADMHSDRVASLVDGDEP
jgi:hypothetical protein